MGVDKRIGEKINSFVVVGSSLVGKNKVWICRCVCGTEKTFWKFSAISHQETCGCGTDIVGLTAKQRRSVLSRMNSYKSGAKSRGFSWELSYEQFVNITTKNCVYCNAAPKLWDCVSKAPSVMKDCPHVNSSLYEIVFNGIDRVDSNDGYTVDNSVACCTACNRAKSDMSIDDFKSQVERMYKWLFQKE